MVASGQQSWGTLVVVSTTRFKMVPRHTHYCLVGFDNFMQNWPPHPQRLSCYSTATNWLQWQLVWLNFFSSCSSLLRKQEQPHCNCLDCHSTKWRDSLCHHDLLTLAGEAASDSRWATTGLGRSRWWPGVGLSTGAKSEHTCDTARTGPFNLTISACQ